jgi:hypothetical protein
LYPLAALLAAAGLTALAQHSRRWIWIGGGLVACHVLSALAVFPAEMASANEAWGGAANAHKYLSDSSVDWAQQLPHVKQWVDAHPGEECWFAYSAYPDLRPQAYQQPEHPDCSLVGICPTSGKKHGMFGLPPGRAQLFT